MLDREREKEEDQSKETTTVENLVAMLRNAVLSGPQFIKDICIRQARRMAINLKKQYSYVGALKQRILDDFGKVNELNHEQRKKAIELMDEVLA